MSEITYTQTDSEEILNNLISHFEEYTGETLNVGDARRQFLHAFAYVFAQAFSNLEDIAKQNLLRYARGDVLRALGELTGTEELPAEKAMTEIMFTLSEAKNFDITIKSGTRVTADGKIFFATDEDLVITAGLLTATVTATATVAGACGNGFAPGQLTSVVDGSGYVMNVTNLTTSEGGRDAEMDDELRERIREAPFSFSVAGPIGAYRYLALSANVNVGDAAVYSPSAGEVVIAVIKKDGSVPTEDDEILNDVLSVCSAKDSRPLTDHVSVVPATSIETSLNMTYYIAEGDAVSALNIQKAVKEAVNEYVLWQTTKIGRDINPSKLVGLVLGAGASDIEVLNPQRTTIGIAEVAQFTEISVNYGGLTE